MQADQSIDRSQGGLGIGLTLAKTLVEMHNGAIEAFSNGPGQGSEFRFWLPVAEAHTDGHLIEKHLQPAKAEPYKVLVADDMLVTAESRASVLTLEGYDANRHERR